MSALRTLIVSLAAAAALLQPAAAAPRPPSDSDTGSVTFQVNPAHDGHVVFPNGFKPPLKQKWLRKLDGVVLSYPIVANGLVFVIANGQDSKYTLDAFDLANGKTVWTRRIRTNHIVHAAYDNGRIFVLEFSGTVDAFSADRAGTPLWAVKLKLGQGYYTPPIASGGHLIIVSSIQPPKKGLFSLNEEDGAIEWKVAVDMSSGVGPPAIAEDAVFLANVAEAHKFDLATGKTLWFAKWAGTAGGNKTPAYFKNRLYVRDVPIVAETGKGKSVASIGTIYAPAFWTAPNGKDYEITLNDHKYLAVDPKSENAIWSFAGHGVLSSLPLVINDVVIAGSSDGTLYAIDAATGTELWESATGLSFLAPIEQGGVLWGPGAGGDTLVIPAGPALVAYVQDGAR